MHAPDNAAPASDARGTSPARPGSVGYVTTAEDTADAYRLHNLARFWSWQTAAALGLTLMIGAIMFTALHAGWRWTAGGLVACAAGGIAFSRAMVQWYVPVVARRVYHQQKHLQDELTVTWDMQGLRVVTPNSDSRTPWSHYLRWREDARVVLLYQSDALFQFIPKRVLSMEEVASLRAHAVAAPMAAAVGADGAR